MRVFILYANPVATSFGAALHEQVVATLHSRGHEIDDCDLYLESFDPIMSTEERIAYHDPATSRTRVLPYADRLLAAEALVLAYPVWNKGFPAILKGFFDQVFIPGVGFNIGPDGVATPALGNLKKNRSRLHLWRGPRNDLPLGRPAEAHRQTTSARDAWPCREVRLSRPLRHEPSTPKRRAAFLKKVKLAFKSW